MINLHLTWQQFAIVCPLVFLAGLIDAIGGGGGLISLPAYLIAGIPTHMAIATNKLSSACGTTLATGRFIKKRLINFKLGIPSVIAAIIGSYIGANLSLKADESIMQYILLIVLPVTAIIVLNRKAFPSSDEEKPLDFSIKTYAIVLISATVIGFYDGFYGPGTGTFLIIAFTSLDKMNVLQANGQAKLINLTTNYTSLAVYLFNGQVVILLGIAAAVANMIGAYIGSSLALKKGMKIIRPAILLVLLLLLLKVLGVY